MGTLVVDTVDLNDAAVIALFEKEVQSVLLNPSSYHQLQFQPGFYFSVPPGVSIPAVPGWYIILQETTPIYVGQAGNLNSRLNTNQGSLDNFSAKSRTSDPQRNFIKRFTQVGRFQHLRVCLITHQNLASLLATPGRFFSPLDVGNIEKALNILRGTFCYK